MRIRRVLVVVGAMLVGTLFPLTTAFALSLPTFPMRGSATDGISVTVAITVDSVTLSKVSPPGTDQAAPAGQAFLIVVLDSPPFVGNNPNFSGFPSAPITAVHIKLGGRSLATEVASAGYGPLAGAYYALVPSKTTQAVLAIDPTNLTALESLTGPSGSPKLTSVTFGGTSETLNIAPTASSTTSTTTVTTPGSGGGVSRSKSTAGSATSPVAVGSGVGGGVVVLVIVIGIRRRRRFDRAFRAGTIVIIAPSVPRSTEFPALPVGATVNNGLSVLRSAGLPALPAPSIGPVREEPVDEAIPLNVVRPAHRILIKILGPLEVEGLERPIDSASVRELLVFLALHPGRAFTSAELRSSIWVLGRTEVTADTFRQYMTGFRRALGRDAVTRHGYRYMVADFVVSDWGLFSAASEQVDWRETALDRALGLVRGPVLVGAFEGRNGPFSWAVDIAHAISRKVVEAAHELAELRLAAGNPRGADDALRAGLLCVPRDVQLRRDHLRVGAVLGGTVEIGARLAVASRVLDDDPDAKVELEDEARLLGWGAA